MRTGLDGTTNGYYLTQRFETWERIRVSNGSDTLVDLSMRVTSYNLQLPQPNLPIGALTVNFARDAIPSLAPFVVGSSLNRLDNGVTYSPLLQIGRTVTMDIAIGQQGAGPAGRPADGSPLWYEVFRGTISKPAWGQFNSHVISITALDLGGVLQKMKSQTAFTYLAGTAIETVAQQILTNNGATWVSFSCPVATGKVLPNDVAPGLQKTIWEQLANLARQSGLVLWWRYSGAGTLQLVMFAPERGKTLVDQTFSIVDDYTELAVDENDIGSTGYIVYFDGNGVQQSIGPMVDSASILKYGGHYQMERPFWIVLTADSPVRDSTSATALLTQALSDVADPDVVATVTMPPLWFGEAAVDLYSFPTITNTLFDSPMEAAPFSITIQRNGDQQPYTTVNVRGKPSAGRQAWQRVGGGMIVNGATPSDGEDGLINWREYTDANGVTTVVWDRIGLRVLEVWEASILFNAPLPADPWALVKAVAAPLSPGTFSLAYAQPGEGQRRLIQVETRLKEYRAGIVYRLNQFGTPAPLTWNAVPTETAGDVTLAVVLRDPRQIISEVRFYTLILGVRSGPFSATVSDANYYAYTLALDPKHPVGIQPELVRNDGFPTIFGETYTADIDKESTVVDVRKTRAEATGVNTIFVDADTDTASLWRKEDVGGTLGSETSIAARGSDPRFGSFTVSAGGAERIFRVYGKNAAGVAGPYVDLRIETWAAPVVVPTLDALWLSVVNHPANPGPGYVDVFDLSWDISTAVNNTDHRLDVTFYTSGAAVNTQTGLLPSAGGASYVKTGVGSTVRQHSATVTLRTNTGGGTLSRLEGAEVSTTIDAAPYP